MLAFRNVDASPDDPVEDWPTEAVQAALERGGLSHWRRLVATIRDDPWGPVARRVEEAVAVSEPYGVTVLMRDAVSNARRDAMHAERAAVAEQIRDLVSASTLTRAEFASRTGTSPSRLSTYLSGRVTPSATMLLRMRRVSATAVRSGPDLRSRLGDEDPQRDVNDLPHPEQSEQHEADPDQRAGQSEAVGDAGTDTGKHLAVTWTDQQRTSHK